MNGYGCVWFILSQVIFAIQWIIPYLGEWLLKFLKDIENIIIYKLFIKYDVWNMWLKFIDLDFFYSTVN